MKRVAGSSEAAAFFVGGETNEHTYAVNGASVWTEADAGVLS